MCLLAGYITPYTSEFILLLVHAHAISRGDPLQTRSSSRPLQTFTDVFQPTLIWSSCIYSGDIFSSLLPLAQTCLRPGGSCEGSVVTLSSSQQPFVLRHNCFAWSSHHPDQVRKGHTKPLKHQLWFLLMELRVTGEGGGVRSSFRTS